MDMLPYLSPSCQLLPLDLPDHPGRIPRHYRILSDIPGNDRPCTHHCILADPHPWQDDGAASYPYVVLDHDRLGYLPALDPFFRLKMMGGGIDLNDN